MTEAKEVGIKETMEMIAAMKVLATFASAVMEDHALNSADLVHVVELSSKYQALADAYTGKEAILAELKDLKKAELTEVIMGMYDAFEVFTKAKTLSKFR